MHLKMASRTGGAPAIKRLLALPLLLRRYHTRPGVSAPEEGTVQVPRRLERLRQALLDSL